MVAGSDWNRIQMEEVGWDNAPCNTLRVAVVLKIEYSYAEEQQVPNDALNHTSVLWVM